MPAALAMILLVITWRLFPNPEELHGKPVAFKTQGLPRAFWLLLAGVGCLAVGYTDFALIAFHFKKEGLLPAAWIPVSYGVAMGLQGLASLACGRWFDKWSVKTLIAISIPAAAFTPLAFFGGLWPALAGLALWTVGMGAQGTIMKAFVAEVVPSEHRGSAYGILNSAYGVLWFAGSALMGWLYDRSLLGLVIFSVTAQLISLPFLFALTRPQARVS